MDQKPFSAYVAERKQLYKYTLKFALSSISDSQLDMLERALKKYSLKSASKIRTTPMQSNPLDFPNVQNVPVHSCDIEIEYPASLDFLRTYICNALSVSPIYLAVYSENDPRAIETDLYVDRTSPEFKEKYKTTLGSDYPETEPAENLYGDAYNMKFLQALADVRKTREDKQVINDLSPAQVIDHSSLPKGYSDVPKQETQPTFFGRIPKDILVPKD